MKDSIPDKYIVILWLLYTLAKDNYHKARNFVNASGNLQRDETRNPSPALTSKSGSISVTDTKLIS